MKKQHYIIPVLLLSSLLLFGCGKTQNAVDNVPSPNTVDSTTDNTAGPAADNAPDPAETNKADTDVQDMPTDQPRETPKPQKATISLKEDYSDTERAVSVLGLQEYKKIKTEKYTDKASKGKKYLVLFLKIRNMGNEKDYFNVNYLTAEVDGKETENTFLFNEPEGYPTIFANIGAGETAEGFIVWEVPEDWKKIKVTYKGWEDIDGLTLDADLSRKNLKKPGQYNGKD